MKAGSVLLPDAQPVNDGVPCNCPADPTARITWPEVPGLRVRAQVVHRTGGWRLEFRLRRPPLGRGRPLREAF